MVPIPLLNERDLDLLVAYSLDCDEEMNESIVNAFLAGNVDVFDQSTLLWDWVDPVIFEALQWTDDRPLYLSTLIWNHQVVITPDEVRIYD